MHVPMSSVHTEMRAHKYTQTVFTIQTPLLLLALSTCRTLSRAPTLIVFQRILQSNWKLFTASIKQSQTNDDDNQRTCQKFHIIIRSDATVAGLLAVLCNIVAVFRNAMLKFTHFGSYNYKSKLVARWCGECSRHAYMHINLIENTSGKRVGALELCRNCFKIPAKLKMYRTVMTV